jgi:flavin-dependent dehydrogenase
VGSARIAVVGGGPAGGSAALALARAGAEVDLYVPERPGEKPCGGAVPEHVLPRLAGFDPETLPAVVSPEAVLENARGSLLEIDLRGIRIFRRSDLDRAIVEAAVAAGANRIDRRVEIGDLSSYDWIVGADGARGRSRRSLGLEPQGDSVGLGGSLHGLRGDQPWKRLVLGFPDLADSYLWIFPRAGGASVGIAYTPERLSDGAARAALDLFLDRHLPPDWRDLPGPRYRYPIPVFGPWTLEAARRGVENRILLVGDAAALADPLTREGIRYGMLSGLWAAESLLAGTPEAYPERLRRELEEEMERAARARSLFFDDPVGQWMVPVSRVHPGIRRVLSDLLACRQPYRGLRGRLLRAAVSVPTAGPRPRTRTPSAPAP